MLPPPVRLTCRCRRRWADGPGPWRVFEQVEGGSIVRVADVVGVTEAEARALMRECPRCALRLVP